MTKGRDNAAENLNNLLEFLRTRRQSGMVSIERRQGGYLEEGEIYFQAGQPIYAHTGTQSGQEALLTLLAWRQVYFAFLPDEPRPAANMAPITGDLRHFTNTSPIVNSYNRAPVTVNTFSPTPTSSTSPTNTTHTDGLSSSASPVSPQRNTDRLSSSSAEHTSSDSPLVAFPDIPRTPGLEWLTPKKVGNDRNVMSLPLTRTQRSLYMLVDGQRTVSDLSRCIRKNLQEIERLLTELQEQGLISL